MFGKNILLNIILVAACTIFVAGCGNKNISGNVFEETAFEPSENTVPASSEETLVIKLVVNEAYCQKTACSCVSDIASRDYQSLQDLLKEKYNIDLVLTYVTDEYYIKDSLFTGRYDGVITKPWLAYMITPGSSFKFKRIVDLLDVYNNQWLRGMIITKSDSGLNTLKDIDGKILAAGQEDSFEKYHSPLRMLAQEKVVPKEIIHKASCSENIGLLTEGNADVAIISDYTLIASRFRYDLDPSQIRKIGETEPMPLCSVIIDLSKISEENALRLRNALLDLSGENAPEELSSDGFVMPAKWIPVPFETK